MTTPPSVGNCFAMQDPCIFLWNGAAGDRDGQTGDLSDATLTWRREHQTISKGSKTNVFSSFGLEFPFPISPYRTTYTCLWYFTTLCLRAMCAVLHLCWHHSLYATFSKGMQITDDFVHGYFPRLWTSPDLQDPVSQMWQDITGKFFNPSECLTDTHFITHKKTTFLPSLHLRFSSMM